MRTFRWASSEFDQWVESQSSRPSGQATYDFLSSFGAFECFHACRSQDLASYYENGLIPHNGERLRKEALRIFEIAEHEFNSVDPTIDEGIVYVALDKKHLIEKCGHYLIYGSEHILGLTRELAKYSDSNLREKLSNIGVPTVFCLRIPVSLISSSDILKLAEFIPAVIWGGEDGQAFKNRIDWTFFIREKVPAEHIFSHFHPDKIPNPIYNGAVYKHIH